MFEELTVISKKKTRGFVKWILKITNSIVDKLLEEEDKKGKE